MLLRAYANCLDDEELSTMTGFDTASGRQGGHGKMDDVAAQARLKPEESDRVAYEIAAWEGSPSGRWRQS